MTIHLDHLMVPSRNKVRSAKLLAELLDVPWSESGTGPFVPVYVNDGLTLDFDEWADPFPLIHFCFRVSPEEFEAILQRLQATGIPYRSNVHGPVNYLVDTEHAGRIVYWNEPDGHQWEMLTLSYARQVREDASPEGSGT
ncbi:VOC family protein [Metapseudomonas boanensis]|uniref:VOC family protein n=1 Tax=Metapseudomonas boanensis TaxID=2822138 RepID=A0ABS5XID8_9GAMM|nr:VOC family protein [Pseudomonas boanensis]MBT8767458.1 VOC family protein [Pseudomonas boanensis]